MEKSRVVTLEAEPAPLKIDLRRTAIIVVDMQNAFMGKGGLFELMGFDVTKFQPIIQTANKINSLARANGVKVIYVAHRLSPDFREMGGPDAGFWHKSNQRRMFTEHPEWHDKMVIRHTWGTEIIKEMMPQNSEIVVEKPRYSAFDGTDLDTTLKAFDIKYLVFTGIASNICVEASLRDGSNKGYFSIFMSDATSAAGPSFMQDATIHNVKFIYGWVSTSEKLDKALK
jgi:ureidoacrylate peracid hydrolase